MISLSQILPRAQRHTSFTVTSGLAVATETRGGGCREVEGGGGFGWSVWCERASLYVCVSVCVCAGGGVGWVKGLWRGGGVRGGGGSA